MKILLVSDSHGDYQSLDQLAKSFLAMDLYLHAGDSEQDEWSIKPFISVNDNLCIVFSKNTFGNKWCVLHINVPIRTRNN